jgi:hypothetical protein
MDRREINFSTAKQTQAAYWAAYENLSESQ